MSDLSTAKIGTAIALQKYYSGEMHILRVTSITATRIACGTTYLRKADGLIIGSSGIGDGVLYGRIATDKDILKARIARAQAGIAHLRVTEENLIVIESLLQTK